MDTMRKGTEVLSQTSSGDSAMHQVDSLAALKRFARPRPASESCDLCAIELGEEHQHLLNKQTGQVTCACDACAILFCGQEAANFLRIPRRVVRLRAFEFTNISWESLMLPIDLAFFVRQPEGEVMAMYPSPAGAMQSLVAMPTWAELFGKNVDLITVQPSVEAVLVNRMVEPPLYLIVPVDACYRLIGLIRTKWHGLSGGAEVWQAIAEFFEGLNTRAGVNRA